MSIRISIPSPNQLSCPQLNQSVGGLTFSQRQTLQAVGPNKSGQITSYRTGDDGDFEYGRGASFTGLTCNNPFNNSNRFTDQSGGQTYSDNIIVDWLTGLMWYRVTSSGGWNTAIDTSIGATTGGYTDWFLPNLPQLAGICNYSVSIMTNYAPFNIDITGTALWSSTSQPSATANAMLAQANNALVGVGKGNSRLYIYCRYFALSDMGL